MSPIGQRKHRHCTRTYRWHLRTSEGDQQSPPIQMASVSTFHESKFHSLKLRWRTESASEEKGRGKLVVFAGSTPNIGTTIVSCGTALMLAKTANCKVGYLCLNLKSSKIHRYLDKAHHQGALNDIHHFLRSGSLNEEILLQACHTLDSIPNLHILFGNNKRQQADDYTALEIEHLLQVASTTFDICIIDVNAYWDNAATIISMMGADQRVIVTTSDQGHYQEDIHKWIHETATMLGFSTNQFQLVITSINQMQMPRTDDKLLLSQITEATGMQIIGKLGKYMDLFTYANQGKLLQLFDSLHPLHRELLTIVQEVVPYSH